MKESLFLFLLFACTYSVQASETYIPEVSSIHQFDKTTMINKKIRSAQESMNRGDYQSAKTILNSLLKLSPGHSKAKELLEQCKKGVLQQKEREGREYNDACKTGMVESLQNFINRHPKSEYVRFAKERIDDYSIWEIAKKRNTIDSYNLYLQKSTVQAYKEEALAAIEEVKMDQVWSQCMNSEDEHLLENFIKAYPNSSHITEAKYKLNLLTGERLYNEGLHGIAYLYLSDANIFKPLSGDPEKHYLELKEINAFREVLGCANPDYVRKYLKTIDIDSPYYLEASNHLAKLLGAKLNAWSSENSIKEALSYAKSEDAKKIVKNYINLAQKELRSYKRARARNSRKRWWRNNFKIGIDADFEIGSWKDDCADMLHALGVSTRFGSYKGVISVVTGVRYRWFRVHPIDRKSYYGWDADSHLRYYEDRKDYHDNGSNSYQLYGGAICIPLSIRFNILSFSKRSRLYLGICGEYGAAMFESKGKDNCLNRNFISVAPQIGLFTSNFEFALYWKSYVDGPFVKDLKDKYPEFKCNSLAGIQLAAFF